MTEKIFLDKMLDVLNREENINLDDNLSEIEEWDSLAYVAFLSMAAEFTNKIIRASEVRNAQTVRDLFKLIAED